MRVGVIGCGFVFDLYMATWKSHANLTLAGVWDIDPARRAAVAKHYEARVYDDQAALLGDPDIDIVANFTTLEVHAEVTRAALNAGKHVYSEKPLTAEISEAKDLFDLAAQKGLRLSVAPSNTLSSSVRTLEAAIDEGLIGSPQLVYAEFDDGPIHLMRPEDWMSPSGAPWPMMEEYTTGCTREHAGYHLTWMCALFGPVTSIVAASHVVTPQKTAPPLETPDLSVACLQFSSGVVGRLTCSIAGPRSHAAQVVGERGILTLPTYKDYTAPVLFNQLDWHRLSIRASRFGGSRLLRWLLGAEDQIVPPVDGAGRQSDADGRMDMVAGLAELAEAITNDRAHFPPPDFALHVTELTLLIQASGPAGIAKAPETSFAPLTSAVRPAGGTKIDLRPLQQPSLRRRLAERLRKFKPKRRFS